MPGARGSYVGEMPTLIHYARLTLFVQFAVFGDRVVAPKVGETGEKFPVKEVREKISLSVYMYLNRFSGHYIDLPVPDRFSLLTYLNAIAARIQSHILHL